ncbi:uncharacterized protein LOC144615241, partial [Panthera onca]
MSRLRLLAPLLLFMWQPLWLLVQAAQPPEWALDPAQLTSDPLEAAEPWSSRSSDPPPESPQALTPPAEPGGFNYLGSSAPAQMLAPPKELTETLVPLLDTDSFGELPPGPDEDLNHQLTQHQRLPEVVPVPGWDQNQTIAPPPHLKSKTKTVGLDQAEDHQSFDSNMGLLYPEENLPMGFPGGPDQLPNFSEEAEIPPPLQKTPHHLESPEEAESFLPQGEAQAQHPEPSEETEPSLLEQEAPSQRPESLKDGNSANPQEAPAEPSSTPEEVEPSSVQQEASAHPTEAPEEVEPSPTPQEAPAQPPEPSKDIISQLLAHHEVNVLSPSQSEAQKPSFPNVTVKPLDLTITLTQPAEHPEEAGPTPVQQEAPAQRAERLEEVEPTPVQQEAPPQPAERLEEVEPTPVQQEAPTLVPEFPIEYLTQLAVSDEVTSLPLGQYPDYLMFPRVIGKPLDVEFTTTPGPDKGVESSIAQQEAPPQPLEHTEEAELSLTQQETSGKPPEEVEPSSEQETPGQPSEPPGVIDPSLRQQETPAQPSVPPEEGKPSLSKQEPPAQLPDRFGEAELSPTQEEALAQLAELLNEAESSTQQETPAQSPGEIESSATLQEQPAQPPELPSREVEPSPTQQEHPAQPLWHHKMTVSPPGHYHDQHLNLPNVSVKPPDVQLTMTAEPTTEVGPSAVRHETIAQPSVPLNVEPFETQHEAPTLPPQSPEVESLPVQQETPTQSPESTTQEKLPTQQETPVQYPEYPGEVEPSTTQQEALAQQSQAPEEGESSSTQEEAPTQLPEAQEEGEPSPLQEEGQGQHPQASEGSEPPTTQEESPAQHPQTPEEVESSTQQVAPAQFPVLQESPAISPEPPKEVEPSPTPQEPPAQPSEPGNEAESFPTQQGAPVVSPEPPKEVEPSTQQEAPPQPSDPPEKVEPSPVQQETLSLPLEPLKEIEPSLTQQEVQAQPSEAPEKVEPSPILQQSPTQPPEPSKEAETPPAQQEAPVQPPEPPEEVVAQPPVHNEVTVPPLGQEQAQHPNLPNVTVQPADLELTVTPEPTVEAEQSTIMQQTLAPPEDTEATPPHPEQVQAQHPNLTEVRVQPLDLELTITPEPTTEVETSTTQEIPGHPSEPPKEVVVQPPLFQEVTVPTPGLDQARHPSSPNVTVQPLDLELTITPEPPMEVKASTALKKTTAPPKDLEVTFAHLEQVQVQHSTLNKATTQHLDLGLTITPEFNKEIELPLPMQETPIQPPKPPEEVIGAQPPVYQEQTVLTPGQNQAQHSSLPNITVRPLDLELTITPEPTVEVKTSTVLKKTTAPPKDLEVTFPHLEQVESHHPTLTEVTVQPLDLELTITPESTTEVEPSPAMQETPDQPPEPPKELVAQPPVYQEAAVPTPDQDQAQRLWLPNVTVQPLDLVLTVTTEPTTDVKHSSALQQTTAPPKDLEVTFPHSEHIQHPTLTKVTVKPLDPGLTVTPESTTETEPSLTMQETPTQPPEPPKEVVQYPSQQEVTVPTPSKDQGQQPTLPSVTAHRVDLGLTITPEPTTEAEHSTPVKETTAPPPKDLEVTLAHPEQVQSQHPNLTEVTVPPMDLELTVTAGSSVETEPSPTMRDTPTQPPEPPKEVVVQYPFQQEVTVPTPSKDQGQHPASPIIPFRHVELTITPEPITEAEHSTTLKKTTTPPPKDLEVTLAHPKQVQSQHRNLTEVTVPPMDLEIPVSQQPESFETGFPPTTEHPVVHFVKYTSEKAYTTLTWQPEQNATTDLKICERCTCKEETLSCVGLSPQQRLRRVPVLEPDTYNGTFTILNFQGNSISHIDENVWKGYRWAEKLILRDNYLTELHKDTFEDLLSLQY